MATPAQRFQGWIDSLASSWKDRLRGWMMSWVQGGLLNLIEGIEPEAIDSMTATMLRIRDDPDTPAEVKALIDKAITPGAPLPLLILIPLAIIMLIPTIQSISRPLGNILEQKQERIFKSFRLDPLSVITAWRRDPAAYAKFFDDLKDQGWNEDRIEALKFFTEIIPGVSDLVRMAVREAFSPEIAEKFGQYQDFPEAIVPWLEKQGLSRDWGTRFWAAHWDLPSPSQGFEMLHRGVIDEATLNILLRALDVMPYWRDKLVDISWNVPTRVDIRRFYQLGVIDDTRLRQLYTAFGYHGADLDNIVEFTKRYSSTEKTVQEKELTKAEIYKGVKVGKILRLQGVDLLMDLGYDEDTAAYLLAINVPADEEEAAVKQRELTKADVREGLKRAIITEEEAHTLLIDLRYSQENADFLLKIFKATITPPEEIRDREASKTDIIKAVKQGLITPEDGYLMLQDIGFTPEASQFILMVQAEASPFSPRDYQEFKGLTTGFRRAAGMEVRTMPEGLLLAADEVVRLTRDTEALQRAVTEEKRKLVASEGLPETATAHLKELEVKLHRAEAELSRVKTDYQIKVAEWRHGT